MYFQALRRRAQSVTAAGAAWRAAKALLCIIFSKSSEKVRFRVGTVNGNGD
jgi:hypothetical protein